MVLIVPVTLVMLHVVNAQFLQDHVLFVISTMNQLLLDQLAMLALITNLVLLVILLACLAMHHVMAVMALLQVAFLALLTMSLQEVVALLA